jgi:hypothetical protein
MNSTVFSEHSPNLCAHAFHEAGHAIVLHHFGGTIKEILIALRKDGTPDAGEVRQEPSKVEPARLLNVTVAGGLAERKCRACEELAKQPNRPQFEIETVRWDPGDKACDLIGELSRRHDDLCDRPVDFLLYLPGSQAPLPVTVPVDDNCGDLECADYIYRKEFGDTLPTPAAQESDLQKRLLETRDLLEQPAIWKRVTALAEKLLSDDARAIFLSGESAISVIENA